MIIKNNLPTTLSYVVDKKDVILTPGVNLIDWVNEVFLWNLIKNTHFLSIGTIQDLEDFRNKDLTVTETKEVEEFTENEETQTTTTQNITEEQPVLTEEVVKKAVKTIAKKPVSKKKK